MYMGSYVEHERDIKIEITLFLEDKLIISNSNYFSNEFLII